MDYSFKYPQHPLSHLHSCLKAAQNHVLKSKVAFHKGKESLQRPFLRFSNQLFHCFHSGKVYMMASIILPNIIYKYFKFEERYQVLRRQLLFIIQLQKMFDNQVSFHLPDNRSIIVRYESQSITLELQDAELLQKYKGIYTYEKLPIEFRVLFENLKEFYLFVSTNSSEHLRMENHAIVIVINIIGRMKEFLLPLEEVELVGEMKLLRRIKDLEKQFSNQEMELSLLRETVVNKDKLLQEYNTTVNTLTQQILEKESEHLKLSNKIRQLENQIEDILSEKCKEFDNNHQESRHTEDYTPVKKNYFGNKLKKGKEIEEFGKKIVFKIDENSKYYSKFKMASNEVEKLHGPTYQLYHTQALPKDGKFYFDIKIILIKNNNIVVGVITDKNKEEQFSFKKMNCVCYNGYDGSICEQDKQRYVTIKPKEGNKLRTVVDMTLSQIEWYIIGGESIKTLIGKASIPASISKQTVLPYFQLYWEGNKIKLNA